MVGGVFMGDVIYEEGDFVTIELKNYQADFINKDRITGFLRQQIVKHTRQNWNWKNTKQGMAFKNEKTNKIVYFVSLDITDNVYGVFAINKEWHNFNTQPLKLLSRVPECDIGGNNEQNT